MVGFAIPVAAVPEACTEKRHAEVATIGVKSNQITVARLVYARIIILQKSIRFPMLAESKNYCRL